MDASSPVDRPVAEVAIDPDTARIYEHGWQSWSPSTTYRTSDRPHRPSGASAHVMHYRAGSPAPSTAFQGEGLLAVEVGGGGPVHLFGARAGAGEVPSIRAEVEGSRVLVSANGDIDHVVDDPVDTRDGASRLDAALGRWADGYAAAVGVAALRPAPTIWCSWYYYWTEVSEQDVLENIDAMEDLALPVDVVQLDDGYQAEIGDWLTLSERFHSLSDLGSRIRDRGRRAGIWTAPFLVSSRSNLYADHPDWVVAGAHAGWNWEQELLALDVTHPGAEAYLREVFGTLSRDGFDFFKLDFLYAGALPGPRHEDASPLQAYRRGLGIIREAVGPHAYLLGCGAPILPSVGLVDGMRVSPDTGPNYEPRALDLAFPSQRAAALTGAGRGWQQGRFWVNDPDCLLARPDAERREDWARHIARYGGLRGSSDRLRGLDDWGIETTRRLLASVPPPTPFDAA